MGIELTELIPLKREFQREYFSSKKNAKYLDSCNITKLSTIKIFCKPDIKLRKGETLEDFCISVKLLSELPESLSFPPEYKGVRVFYRVEEPVLEK